MIFVQILQKNHKKIESPLHAISSLHSLYENQAWKKYEKGGLEIYMEYYTNRCKEYNRFFSENAIRIYSENYLPEILRKHPYVYKPQFEEKQQKDYKNLIQFVEDYHRNFCQQKLKGENEAKIVEIHEEFDEKFGILLMEEEFHEEKVKKGRKQRKNQKSEAKEEEIEGIKIPREKKAGISIKPEKKEPNLSEKELEFLGKFYFLLEIDRDKFTQLPRLEQIDLLTIKYNEYISRLSQKYKKKSHPKNLKDEREKLAFLSCEAYLKSKEDQYMYNELQELNFFLNALKKANIRNFFIPHDEMMEKSKDLLKSGKISFESEIPLEKFINFNINNHQGKTIYQVFDKDFLEKTEDTSKNVKKLSDFYTPDLELDEIYNFEFFANTIEIDEDLLLKLFELLRNSTVDLYTLLSGINSGFQKMKTNLRSTFLLIKILCFNYKNFLKITQLIDYYLVDKTCQQEKIAVDSKVKDLFFEIIAGFSSSLIKNNYASNYFLSFNRDPQKMSLYTQIIKEAGLQLKILENGNPCKGSIMSKILAVFVKNKKFEFTKSFINTFFAKNLTLDEIPLAKILEAKETKNPLTLYPYFYFEDNLESKTLIEMLLHQSHFLIKSKIKVKERFFKLAIRNSQNFIPSLCINILPDVLKNFNKSMEEMNKTLDNNKKLLEKVKTIEFFHLANAVLKVKDEFSSQFPTFIEKSREFCCFCHNIFKLAKLLMISTAFALRNAYQKGPRTEQNLKEILEIFQNFEKDFIESMRYYFLKNQEFVLAWLQVIKVFIIIEDMIKLYPQIKSYQKNSIFEIYNPVIPCLHNFFRIISFIEFKEFDQKNNNHFVNNKTEIQISQMKEKQIASQDLDDSLIFEKTLSKSGGWTFDEVFNLIYKVQDSIQNIFTRLRNVKSLSIYRILFKKAESHKINVFLKMEYIK